MTNAKLFLRQLQILLVRTCQTVAKPITEQNKQSRHPNKFPEDISKGELDNPVQPKLYTYPWKYFGAKKSVKRRFQSCYFAEFPWLEYSVQQDAACCFCCRYWSKESSPFGEPTGFSDWQHETGQRYGFTLHNSSAVHLRCLVELLRS